MDLYNVLPMGKREWSQVVEATIDARLVGVLVSKLWGSNKCCQSFPKRLKKDFIRITRPSLLVRGSCCLVHGESNCLIASSLNTVGVMGWFISACVIGHGKRYDAGVANWVVVQSIALFVAIKVVARVPRSLVKGGDVVVVQVIVGFGDQVIGGKDGVVV